MREPRRVWTRDGSVATSLPLSQWSWLRSIALAAAATSAMACSASADRDLGETALEATSVTAFAPEDEPFGTAKLQANPCPADEETAMKKAIAAFARDYLRYVGNLNVQMLVKQEPQQAVAVVAQRTTSSSRYETSGEPRAPQQCLGVELSEQGEATILANAYAMILDELEAKGTSVAFAGGGNTAVAAVAAPSPALAIDPAVFATAVEVLDSNTLMATPLAATAMNAAQHTLSNMKVNLAQIQQMGDDCQVAEALKAGLAKWQQMQINAYATPGVPPQGPGPGISIDPAGIEFEDACAQWEVYNVNSTYMASNAIEALFGSFTGDDDANEYLLIGEGGGLEPGQIAVDPESHQVAECHEVHPGVTYCLNYWLYYYEYGTPNGVAHLVPSVFFLANPARRCEPCELQSNGQKGYIRKAINGAYMCDTSLNPNQAPPLSCLN